MTENKEITYMENILLLDFSEMKCA